MELVWSIHPQLHLQTGSEQAEHRQETAHFPQLKKVISVTTAASDFFLGKLLLFII